MKNFFQNHALVFGKAQMIAAAATGTDFLMLALLVEVFGLYYVYAVAAASVCGGVVNFILNRKWAFRSNSQVKEEAVRYFLVSGGSLLWNTFLVWLLTESLALPYMVSKVMVVACIGLLWNYPLHRYWVFTRVKV